MDTNGDKAARSTLESAISALIEQQQEALEWATFVGMDAKKRQNMTTERNGLADSNMP